MNTFPILLIASGSLACFLATRVSDEMTYLEKPLRILQALGGLLLLLVMPWWAALIIAGALAFGGFPMVIALGALAGFGGTGVGAIAIPLGMLAGARWTLDKRTTLPFITTLVVAAATSVAVHLLGIF